MVASVLEILTNVLIRISTFLFRGNVEINDEGHLQLEYLDSLAFLCSTELRVHFDTFFLQLKVLLGKDTLLTHPLKRKKL
mmetsp:Transcript_3629/g.6644  ORF Transcript_3629/g.6644 Transcript_3629/m.6644 type:complete len:80 (-) Transcript_3629:1206-1445(-)